MKRLLIIVILAALATSAFVPGDFDRAGKSVTPLCSDCSTWVIVDKRDTSDGVGVVYTLQRSDGENTFTKYGLPQAGTSKLPAVGASCTLSNGVFDCGCKYRKLNEHSPIPV